MTAPEPWDLPDEQIWAEIDGFAVLRRFRHAEEREVRERRAHLAERERARDRAERQARYEHWLMDPWYPLQFLELEWTWDRWVYVAQGFNSNALARWISCQERLLGLVQSEIDAISATLVALDPSAPPPLRCTPTCLRDAVRHNRAHRERARVQDRRRALRPRVRPRVCRGR